MLANCKPRTTNQQGFAHILLLILLVAGIGLGVYLIQNRTSIFPRAASEPIGPETSFNLESATTTVNPGGQFKVDVLVSSDFDAANTFSAIISYPPDKLEVVGIEPLIFTTQSMSEPFKSQSPAQIGNIESGIWEKIFPKAQAQTANPMPVISAKTYCQGTLLTVELNWAKVVTSDINYNIIKSPDPLNGVFISAFFDRYQYPIKDTGYYSPLRYNTTYTYYIDNGLGAKSNTVTVTTPANCTATPTPTPTPVPSPTRTPTPIPVPSGFPVPSPLPSGIVVSPPPPVSAYFITKWVEQKDDKNGTLSLVGSVPNPGFKTTQGKRALMATITFKAKVNGDARIDFKPDSAIYRNSDNQNILSISRGLTMKIGGTQSATPSPTGNECRAIGCAAPPAGCNYVGGFTSTCNPVEYDKLTCGNLVCPGSPTPSSKPSPSSAPLPPVVDGKRADLYKDSKKPNFVNDQDVSVFYSKCAEKGVELFGQPASVQPICDILEDGKITVSDWAVLIKFRNKQV